MRIRFSTGANKKEEFRKHYCVSPLRINSGRSFSEYLKHWNVDSVKFHSFLFCAEIPQSIYLFISPGVCTSCFVVFTRQIHTAGFLSALFWENGSFPAFPFLYDQLYYIYITLKLLFLPWIPTMFLILYCTAMFLCKTELMFWLIEFTDKIINRRFPIFFPQLF